MDQEPDELKNKCCLLRGISSSARTAISDLIREYCNWETFSASCQKPGDVILMTSAKYGRMKFGRCIRKFLDPETKQPAQIGCEEDILQ